MNIAVEINPLTAKYLTGIGKVTLHYLNLLQEIDKSNKYFLYVYSMKKDIPLVLYNPSWQIVWYVDSKSKIKENIQSRLKDMTWYCLTFKQKGLFVLLRIGKMILEGFDRIYYYMRYQYSFRKNRIDVMLLFSPHLFPKLFFRKPKMIGLIYDLVWKLFPDTMEKQNRKILVKMGHTYLKRMDALVSISNKTKTDAMEILKLRQPIYTIPLAADKTIFYSAMNSMIKRVKEEYHINYRYILTVATLEPRKNLIRLIEAFSLMETWEKFALVIVGMKGWGNTNFFEHIKEHQSFKRILFTGYVHDNDLAPLYSGAEMFIFPSLYEGFGLPILEAMQCGCPVITSNNSSLPEVAGDASLLIDPYNPIDIARAMDRLGADSKMRKHLIKTGYKRAEDFSWEKSCGLLSKVIESVGSSRF